MKFPKFRRRSEDYEDDYIDYYGDGEYYDDDTVNDGIDVEDGVADDAYGNETENVGSAFEMKLITPKSYDDRCLVNGNAVFLNIEGLNRDNIIRLMDYLGGVIYVINGKVKWSNSSSVIFAPQNVNISGLEDEIEEETEEIAED